MDVRLSPEQSALREAARVLVERLSARSVRDLDDAGRARKLDSAVAVSGWRELRAAGDATDGEGSSPCESPWEPGSSAVEVAIVAEQLGRGAADAALLGPTLAAELRRLAQAPAAVGQETVALTPDLSAIAVMGAPAVAIDDAGASSALALVPAAGGYAIAEVALPAGPAGPAGCDAGVDLTRSFRAFELPASGSPVGGRLLTDEDVTRWSALALAVTSADLVGVMDGAIRLGRDYVAARKQFGVAVGSFQAVQHLLAEALVAMEGSRSVALHAAWAVDALPADEALAAGAVAKAYCARAARRVCETVIQVHGGIGNTWECFAHVYLRRALASSDVLGGVGVNLGRVLASRSLGLRAS